jgi:hypothetical protein
VVAAYLLAGPDFGQLPALTVPVGIIAAIIFAPFPLLSARKRLLIMVAGTGIFILLGLQSAGRLSRLQPSIVDFWFVCDSCRKSSASFLSWVVIRWTRRSSREDTYSQDSEQIGQYYESSGA